MTPIKFKEFLSHGALLQIAPDTFNLVIGPFETIDSSLGDISHEKPLIYQPHFWDFLETKTNPHFLIGAEFYRLNRRELLSLVDQCTQVKAITQWGEVREGEFRKQFEWSQRKFAVGDLQKTVPIILQTGQTHFTSESLCECLKSLFAVEHFGWAYGFWQNQKGYLGQSPEKIIQWNKQTQLLGTTALAGTLPRRQGAAAELINDPKNREEHQLVVEDISSKLEKLSFIDNLETQDTKVIELKHLVHLKTEFTAKIENHAQAFEVIQALHPTAALGLYPPKSQEFSALKEMQEKLNRKNFAGPFAFITADAISSVAAIRNFFFTPSQVEIFSGCGVTALSQYENELTELVNKRDSVKKMMGFSS